MRPDDHDIEGQDGQSVIDRMGMDAREGEAARMLRDGEPITKEQRAALVKDLAAYRSVRAAGKDARGFAKELAGNIGVATSTLNEWINGKYRGDDDRISRLVDQFLAVEAQSDKRVKIRGFAMIRVVVECIMAAVTQAVTRRSMAVITGEPGSGKTTFGRWFADRHDGAVIITASDTDGDAKFIVDALHSALVKTYVRFTRQKMREIVAYLQGHKNAVIIVDECQKLTPDALETLRSIHDLSDPAGERNVPIILFGDETFYKLVVRSRGGERTPISPQITSRLFPVVSIERHGLKFDDDGQAIPASVYTKDDIEAIVKNQRLRLVRTDAIAWAVKLANIHGHGRLRLAARVLEIAIDLAKGRQVGVSDLRAALDLFIGPDDAAICVEEMQRVEPLAMAAAG